MIIKRITAITLTLIFVLYLFIGCESNSNKNLKSNIQLTNVYKSQYFTQPEGYWINNTYNLNDIIYVCYTKDEINYSNNIIYKYNTNGEIIDIVYLLRDGFYNNIIPSNEDTFYVSESTSISNISNNNDLIWEFSMVDNYNFQLTGSSSFYIDYDTNYLYILSGCKIDNQNSYILLVLTTMGEVVHLFYLDDYINNNSLPKNIYKTPDEQIIFEINSYNKTTYCKVDINTKMINEYKIPKIVDYEKDIINIFYNADYSNEYNMYFNTNTGLYGYNMKTFESKLLVNWINSDIEYSNSSLKVVSIIDSENILCIYGYNELVMLTRIPDDEVIPKTIISIATIGSIPLLQTIAVKFNKQSDLYRVVIEDYSVYTDFDNNIYGDIKFNTDLMSGVIYDMIYFTGNMDTKTYTNKDMFVDLYELFETDTDISKTDLLGLLRSKCEITGHLYTLPVTYYLTTLLGKQSQVGTKESLTIEELLQINEALSTGKILFSCDRNDMLNYYLSVGVNDYIDFKNAECNFNNENFIEMIKLLKTLPVISSNDKFYLLDEYEKIETVRNGDSYFMDFMVLSIYELLTMSYYYGEDEYVIKGFPNESGNGAILDRLNYISIVKNSPNKDGAWEFIKFWLSDEVQISQTFAYLPLTNSALSKTLDTYMNKNYYTNRNGLIFYDEPLSEDEIILYNYEDYNFNEKDTEKIIRFFNNTNVTTIQDETIIEIINEEVKSYFSSSITIDQCVNYIQNRIKTYLKEIQ